MSTQLSIRDCLTSKLARASIFGMDHPGKDLPKNKHAQALSRLGASKGGKARAEKLSAERRSEIASNAVRARWDRAKK